MSRNRVVAGAAVATVAVVVLAGLWSIRVSRATTPGDDEVRATTARETIAPPFLMFRTLAPRLAHGRVAMIPLQSPHASRHVAPLTCSRLHYAGGGGLCLVEEAHGTMVKQVLYLFDRRFAIRNRLELRGVPIRARVSSDGRLAAVTVYGEEESPAGERLASESMLIDMRSGNTLADLREFAVTNESGPPIEGPVDIASVAFQSDSDRFFATISTATTRYLVSGSVVARRLTVVGLGFANEALSPDDGRLVVKRLVGDRGYWRLGVLDLATMNERALDQGPRSVDDQVEWLDNERVIYHDVTAEGTGIWVLASDGRSGPRLLLADAFSPAVVR